jgi:hypothetical protein
MMERPSCGAFPIKRGDTKKRSEDLDQKLQLFSWKFLIPIKYRNCNFFSVSYLYLAGWRVDPSGATTRGWGCKCQCRTEECVSEQMRGEPFQLNAETQKKDPKILIKNYSFSAGSSSYQ